MSNRLRFLIFLAFAVVLCQTVVAGGQKTSIKWLKYDAAIDLAQKQGKHIIVHFTASWCGWCKKMEATTYKDPQIIKTINNDFVAAVVDGESYNVIKLKDGDITEKGLTLQFGVRGYPTTWFLEPNGAKIAPAPGYLEARTLQYILDYVRTNSNEKMSFAEYVQQQTLKAGSK